MGINAISANEINDNDLNAIDSAETIEIDSVENTNDISDSLSNSDDGVTDSADSDNANGDADSDSADSDNTNGDADPDEVSSNTEPSQEKTTISVSKTSIQRGNTLYIYLKDSNGNPISGKTLTLNIGNNKYTKTTDKNGAVSLTFN